MALKTYDFKQVAAVFAGIPISGFADGTGITVQQNVDSFTLTVGSDGEGSRAKTNNRSGKVTFSLAQTSAVNALLSALLNLDVDSASGSGIGPFLMKDLSGNTLVAAEKAWIMKQPDGPFGREIANREWVIESDKLVIFHGGN